MPTTGGVADRLPLHGVEQALPTGYGFAEIALGQTDLAD
jgi:hypothetical protein